MLVFSWKRRKQSFKRHIEINDSGRLDMLTVFSSFGWVIKKTLKICLEGLNKFCPDLKFTRKSNEENVAFLEVKVKLN